MGRILLECGSNLTEFPLAGTCLLGRDARCDIVIRDTVVPLYWLEVRWLGRSWAWRLLHGGTATSGAGRALGQGWRSLDAPVGGRVRRVRCGVNVSVALLDSSPPELFAMDLETGQLLEGPEVEILETLVKEDSFRQSGSLVATHIVQGRPVLIRLPKVPLDTDSQGVDLGDEACTLDLNVRTLCAVFTLGTIETEVFGECVRVLLAYAKARRDDGVPEGGWLTRDEAHRLWLDFGGSPESPTERIGWEKGKLRQKLVSSGALAVIRIFENRRINGVVFSRLSISAEGIHVEHLD